MTGMPDPVNIVIALVLVGAIPFIVVMMTAYTKLVVVLMVLRNALGLQQVPPNLILYAIALVLTLFISQPIVMEISDIVALEGGDLSAIDDWIALLQKAAEPVRAHLIRFATGSERAFFMQAATELWGAEAAANVQSDSFFILVPSFVVSELTRAFEIGFLLYLPFIVIDLVVSNILIAMGAMMVSPVTISLPIKLFLFVIVDGWTRLLHGLILSYS